MIKCCSVQRRFRTVARWAPSTVCRSSVTGGSPRPDLHQEQLVDQFVEDAKPQFHQLRPFARHISRGPRRRPYLSQRHSPGVGNGSHSELRRVRTIAPARSRSTKPRTLTSSLRTLDSLRGRYRQGHRGIVEPVIPTAPRSARWISPCGIGLHAGRASPSAEARARTRATITSFATHRPFDEEERLDGGSRARGLPASRSIRSECDLDHAPVQEDAARHHRHRRQMARGARNLHALHGLLEVRRIRRATAPDRTTATNPWLVSESVIADGRLVWRRC